jgi:transcriptional regulator with XRE-family HTH domain
MIRNHDNDDAVLTALGARIARTRLERNMSQQQLAVEAGLSKRTLERIEAGEDTKLSNVVRILRALGMLDRLDALVPEPLPSPIEQLKLHGRRRRRAGRTSGGATRADRPARTWRWGDAPGDGPAGPADRDAA